MFSELVEKTRTIRRFDSAKAITDKDLMAILDCARKSASAGNLQRLRYVIIGADEAKQAFFKVSLGGLLPADKKPTREVAPTAYVVLASAEENPDANLLIDVGICAESIALASAEKGIGACMIRNFDREYFTELVIDKKLHPILVIALGYPNEAAEIREANANDSLKYYKNENEINIVPKLSLSEIVVKNIK